MKIRNILLLLVAIAFTFTGCKSSSSDEPQAKKIKYVKVETINGSTTQNKITFNGKIKEKSLTSLSFRVGGPLAKLTVETGDFVRAGQVIAQIDKRDYQLQVQTSKARFTQTKEEYKRYKILVDQNKIPANTFERIESAYLMAKSAYENAQNKLRDTELKAPFSGYIFEKFVENHQTVAPGAPIVSLIDNSQLEAVVSVSESQLQNVRSSNQSYLNVANAHVNHLQVNLLSVGEKAKANGLYEVKFSLKNNEELNIAPGMTAEVIMYCEEQEVQILIAGSSLFHENTKTYVWVYNPSTLKVEKREVSISLNGAEGKAIVTTGLKNGEQVVTAGVHYLVDGQEVKPIHDSSETNVGGLL
jgi:membrane fusion protein, multidrug efflux system